MIQVFKRKDISPVFFLVFIYLGVRLFAFTHVTPPSLLDNFELGLVFKWSWLSNLHVNWPILSNIIYFIVHVSFSFYLNYVINRERFFAKKSFLPALAYLLLSSWFPTTGVLSLAFVSNVCLFIAFSLVLQLYNLSKARGTCFSIGLWVGLACLAYFPAVLFVLLFVMLIFLLRPFVIQEILAYFIGLICVIYFAGAWFFLTGNLTKSLNQVYFHFALPLNLQSPMATLISSVVSISLFLYGAFLINQTGEQNSMAVRKKWNALFFYSLFALFVGLFSPIFPSYTWIVTITPFSILLSQAFQHKQEKFNNFTFFIFIIILLFTQWMFI